MPVNIRTSVEVKVVFHTPDWFPQDRFEYNTGQPNYDYKNHAEDQLWKRFGKLIDETCWHPMNSWIIFEYEGELKDLDDWIAKRKKELETFLNRYKESK